MTLLYGYATEKGLPQEFHTDQLSWDRYVSEIWTRLFIYNGIDKKGTIVKFAPGNSMKIGLALEKIGFEGTLYLVDPLREVLNSVSEKYKAILPKATIIPLYGTVESVSIPHRADLILAHHPLDDMLLAAVASMMVPDLFDSMSKEHESARNRVTSETVTAVFSNLIEFFHRSQPNRILLCQYPSLRLKRNKIETLNLYASDVLKALQSHFKERLISSHILQSLLNQHENFNDEFIGTAVLNAENWLVFN